MRTLKWSFISSALVGASMIGVASPSPTIGQQPSTRQIPNAQLDSERAAVARAQTVSAVASTNYDAGAFHRWFAGDGYRDLWGTSVRVPVLDLHTFDGGLHPLKEGGGAQTKNLHLEASTGEEWVFRLVDKGATGNLPELRSTPVNWLFQDAVSEMNPGAAMLTAPILAATGVLHPTAVLIWMPDDPALGEFRRDFANKLGMIEEFPNVPKGPAEVADKLGRAAELAVKGEKSEKTEKAGKEEKKTREAAGKVVTDTSNARADTVAADSTRKGADKKEKEKEKAEDGTERLGFGGATKIIDSPELLKSINADAKEHVDERAFLMARLSDFLVNDNDRGTVDQWKWARLASGPKDEWEPIARDRDHAFVSATGFENDIARLVRVSQVKFDGRIDIPGLTFPNYMDERLFAGLEKPVWDSVAREFTKRVTDSVIVAATLALPPEYRSIAPRTIAVLKQRRDAMPAAADEYYHRLAARVEVHGTDAPDVATIRRTPDGPVSVRLESGGKQYFSRTFYPSETHEILVYLHGGDDTAVVTGRSAASILVRVIGGNGNNTFVDSSTVGGTRHPTRFYDAGLTSGFEDDTLFERLPLERRNGLLAQPVPNYGGALRGFVGLSDDRTVGLDPRIGVARYDYGFMDRPYASMLRLDAEYAPFWKGARVAFTADRRFESSPFHMMFYGRMSDLQVVNFHGFGNATPDSTLPDTYFQTHQRQWMANPSVGLAFGSWTDVTLGPVFQHVSTDSTRSPFLTSEHPYGFGNFSEAGVLLDARYDRHDDRSQPTVPTNRVLVEAKGAYYPAAMDVRSSFGEASLALGAALIVPLPTHPILNMRAGGKKLWGDYPFFEAATLGGMETLRFMDTQRYAGDASLYGTSELLVPLAHFKFLIPAQAGIVGDAEAGRVYFGGQSPGGWHTATAQGIWVGRVYGSQTLTLLRTTEPSHQIQLRLGLGF
jgi:hypothetical protein